MISNFLHWSCQKHLWKLVSSYFNLGLLSSFKFCPPSNLNCGSISNFATGSFKFLFALIQVFSKVFNLEAIGWEDHLVSFYTLIIACQGHISIVTAIFEFSNGCLKFCLKLSFTNLTIQAIMAILNKKMILVNIVIYM